MGQANPLEYLDFLGAVKTGFDMGQKIQDNRQRALDQQRLIELNMDRLSIEREREKRLREQQTAIINERELDRVAEENVRRDSARYGFDVQDALRAGATPIQAKSSSMVRNPSARADVVRSFDEFNPTPPQPLVAQPLNFGDADALVVGNTVVKNPAKEAAKETALQKNVRAIVDAQRRSGLVKDETEAAALEANLFRNGGKLPTLSETGREKLSDKTAALDLTDQVNDEIEGFDAKYGKGEFDRYIGRFDAPIDQIMDIVRKRNRPEDVAALEVLTKFAGIRNRTLKTRSGGTVTEGEGRRLADELGDKADKNLPVKLRVFRDGLRNDLKLAVGAMDNLTLPKNLVDVIEGRATRSESTGSLSREKAMEFLRQAGGDKEKARKLARDSGFKF